MNMEPTQVSNITAIIGAVAGVAISYGVTVWRGAGRASEHSNRLLRELVDDQKRKLEDMVKEQEEMRMEIEGLKSQILILTTDKVNLEDLILRALKEHFASHPEAAKRLRQARSFKAKDHI